MARSLNDWRYLTAGAAASVILPGLVLGLGAPLWAGLAGAAAAFGGLVLVMGPKAGAGSGGRQAVADAAIAEAEPALASLEQAAGRIKDRAVKAKAQSIARLGRACIDELEEAPASLSTIQRLITYYIPRAAELTEGYAQMEAQGLGNDRRAAIADLLVKLEDAFKHYRDQLADETLRALDVDIRLVGEALAEDIGAPAPGGRRTP